MLQNSAKAVVHLIGVDSAYCDYPLDKTLSSQVAGEDHRREIFEWSFPKNRFCCSEIVAQPFSPVLSDSRRKKTIHPDHTINICMSQNQNVNAIDTAILCY